GLNDAFVAKVDPDGNGLAYATFLGGSEQDGGYGIAVDGNGDAVVVGGTRSTELDPQAFPVAVGPDLTANGDADGFLTKLSPNGSALLYSGFIGGTGFDSGVLGDSGVDIHPICVAVDQQGSAYLMTDTSSSESSLPLAVGPDLTFNGAIDVLVLKYGAA